MVKLIGLAILKGDFFIDTPTLRSSYNYVGVRIYQGIWMIKRSEMRGGATVWDKHLPAVTTIFNPFLVCLKPKILPMKQPTFEKKKFKDASLGRI